MPVGSGRVELVGVLTPDWMGARGAAEGRLTEVVSGYAEGWAGWRRIVGWQPDYGASVGLRVRF